MPIFIQHQENSYQWAIWKMEESEDSLLSLLPHPSTYIQQIQHFTAPHRRQEWITVRVLLYRMLGCEKDVQYKDNGKPFIVDGSYHISISHTKGYAAVILSKQHEVGIDIEQLGRRVEKVVSHYMRSDEIPNLYQGDKIWSLLLHWSAKEVIYKCLDIAEVDLIKHLRIYPFTVQQEGEFRSQEYRTSRQQVYLIYYQIHSDFVLTYTII
jgi:phosphopantetheinyl transferase